MKLWIRGVQAKVAVPNSKIFVHLRIFGLKNLHLGIYANHNHWVGPKDGQSPLMN